MRLDARARLQLLLLVMSIALAGCGSPSGLLFYPMKDYVRTPQQLDLAYQDVSLKAADGVELFAWYLPPQGEPRGNLLYLHGNGENISTHMLSIAWLPEQGYGVLALDYRGYGRSQGKAKLPDVFLDLEAASDWLFANTEAPHFLLGQSLGAALAAGFSNHPKAQHFNALLLDAPFARYQDIGRYALSRSWFGRVVLSPAVRLLPDGYDPQERIVESRLPTLFYASPNDAVVPLSHTEALYQAAPEPKQLSLHQGGHIATYGYPDQRQLTLQFLQRYSRE
ncbi:MAG: alpha/beta fold hydrolase [Halopseudomonas sp.]